MHTITAIDVETSGFTRGDDITRNHQIVSIGLVIADLDFDTIDKLYLEIKPNGTSHWDTAAEKIHGLSREYLEENGISEEDAVVKIAEFLLRYHEPSDALFFLGHNPRNFDVPFFKKLMTKYGVEFKIAHRVIDSYSVGFTCLGAKDSDELFNMFYKKRGAHNALRDAEMALGVCKNIRKIISDAIDE